MPTVLQDEVMYVENYEAIEQWLMVAMITGLVGFMGFIVWDLAKRSKAGRWGTLVLFFALGLGVLGFVIKTVVIESMEGGF